MKKEKVLVNKMELCKLLSYLEQDECKHYMSYTSPKPRDHIYVTIKNLKKEIVNKGKIGDVSLRDTRLDEKNSPIPKIRLEKRAGREVTVIAGLHTYGVKRLDDIAGELKLTLATGGTVKNGMIEIQGDKVAAIKTWFIKKSG